MTMGSILIICAFDPVDELDGKAGVFAVDAELAGRLVAEHRVELVRDYASDSMRFVPGSEAYIAAREALRHRRSNVGRRVRKTAAVES